eukprot:7479923-Pyramimonas_sp.AAC.1
MWPKKVKYYGQYCRFASCQWRAPLVVGGAPPAPPAEGIPGGRHPRPRRRPASPHPVKSGG